MGKAVIIREGMNLPFVGATEETPGIKGLVPPPSTEDVGGALLSDGTWGIPKSVTDSINELRTAVNTIIETLNQSAAILKPQNNESQ